MPKVTSLHANILLSLLGSLFFSALQLMPLAEAYAQEQQLQPKQIAEPTPQITEAEPQKTPSLDRLASPELGRLRAAIFIQNNADPSLNDSISAFRDLLSARLTESGFSILDSHDVIARFEGYKGTDEGLNKAIAEAAKLVQFEKSEAAVDQLLTGASALRIAQMLDANYLIIATLSSLGEESKVFNASGSLYKTSNEVVIRTLRTAIRVLEGDQGGSVYGDTVAVQKRMAGSERLAIVSSDANHELIDDAAKTIASNISEKIKRIRDSRVDIVNMAELTLKSNVEGATVELDGAVLGSAPGSFIVRRGLHQIAVSKERYATWQRTINVVPNQVITVTLERSNEGQARHAEALRIEREEDITREKAKAEVAIAKEQSEAEAFSKKKVAEGEGEFRKKSYTKIEGPVEHLEIETKPDAVVKVEKE